MCELSLHPQKWPKHPKGIFSLLSSCKMILLFPPGRGRILTVPLLKQRRRGSLRSCLGSASVSLTRKAVLLQAPRSGPSVKPVEILLPEMTGPFSRTEGRALLGDLLMIHEGLETSLADTKRCLLGSCVLFTQRIVGALGGRAVWERE